MKIRILLYILIQCTWGIIQTLLGFIVFLINIKNKHYFYHGAIITEREIPSSVSLGMFVFTTTSHGNISKFYIYYHMALLKIFFQMGKVKMVE